MNGVSISRLPSTRKPLTSSRPVGMRRGRARASGTDRASARSAISVGLALSEDLELQDRDDQDEQEDHVRDRGRVAHLEALERIYVEVVGQNRACERRPALGHDEDLDED